MRLRDAAFEGPTLVVAPINTHDSWKRHYEEETDLSVKVINRKNRDWFVGDKGTRVDVYVMHYEALRLMPELRKFGFGHGIFDECQKIKNRNARMTKAAKRLGIPYLTDMSGSPATTRPDDLWSILNHLKPRTYSSYWGFYEKMVDYEIQYPQGYRKTKGPSQRWFREGLPAIRPFYDRRRQEECIDIPPKLYNRIYVDLAPGQRRIYNEMRDQMIAWIKGLGSNEEALVAPAIIAQLTRLQMMAVGTPFFTEDDKIKIGEPSSKADAVMHLLEDNDGEQFVIFSQFKGPLRVLKKRFEQRRVGGKPAPITYGSFTGDDHPRLRNLAKREFIDGKRRVLLGTIGSGGVGVDGLQHASCNVIFIDRNWSPALNEQAEDRLHRGGQTRTVNVFDIIARDTVDWGRLQRIELKATWLRQLLEGMSPSES